MAAAKQAHEVQVREAQLAQSRAKAQALLLTLHREVNRLGITTHAGTVDPDPSPGTVEDQEMKRREAIALATKIAVGASLTAADHSRLAGHEPRFAETAVTDMTEALSLRDPSRARAMLSGRITLATNQYRCGETELANASTGLVLASINEVSSRRTARKLITLGTEIRQHTTDSTVLDLAHRISTSIAA